MTPHRSPFELEGADGGPIRGDIRVQPGGGQRPAVVICHGFKGFKDWGFFPRLADRIARAGAIAVSFNFSGSGVGPDGEHFSEPERFGHATFDGDQRDLVTVIDALRAGGLSPDVQSPTRLGLFGHSRGGGNAVLYTGASGGIDALVTWAAIARALRWDEKTVQRWKRDGMIEIKNQRTGEVLPLYRDLLDEIEADSDGRFDMVAAAARVECPWLVVHGEVDEAVSVGDAKRLSAATAAESELLIIPRGGHTLGARHPWAGTTPELDHALGATVDWFGRHLF